MFWLITILAVVVNEAASGERWQRNAVRNILVLILLVKLAEKDPGEMLVLAVIAFSAFVAHELYILDRRRKKEIFRSAADLSGR